MEDFRHQIEVRWSDCDANHHVRHSAYADFCTHVRIEWLKAHGFGFEQFQAQAFGPVIFKEWTEYFKEWTEYFKEVRMSERLTVNVRISGLSEDGSRFRILHDILKEDGRLAARHEVSGAWMDMKLRKLTVPPTELVTIFRDLAHSEDFEVIPAKRA